jgi:hypothetical protein
VVEAADEYVGEVNATAKQAAEKRYAQAMLGHAFCWQCAPSSPRLERAE